MYVTALHWSFVPYNQTCSIDKLGQLRIFFLIAHDDDSWISIGILKQECAVWPPIRTSAAIPDEATQEIAKSVVDIGFLFLLVVYVKRVCPVLFSTASTILLKVDCCSV